MSKAKWFYDFVLYVKNNIQKNIKKPKVEVWLWKCIASNSSDNTMWTRKKLNNEITKLKNTWEVKMIFFNTNVKKIEFSIDLSTKMGWCLL